MNCLNNVIKTSKLDKMDWKDVIYEISYLECDFSYGTDEEKIKNKNKTYVRYKKNHLIPSQ